LQRWEEAVEAYRNAIALEPNFFWSHNNLADALFQLQHWQEAAEAYQRAIALKDDFPWSHYNLGETLSQLEQWEPASQTYQTALEIDPNLPNGWEKLADAIQEYDPLSERALQAYRQAIKDNSDNIELIQKTINLFPNQVEFYVVLAEAFVRNNDLDQALVVCRMGLNIQPNYEKALRLEKKLLSNS
jgi:tetratricopeptide (TPR) repeat protein